MDISVNKERLCVVMPVYNEESAIGGVLEKWHATLSGLGIDFEIRAYNDGSRDGSLEAMRDAAKRCGGRVVTIDKPNEGHGPTILRGYRAAAADGFDWVFQVDSDDEMGPEQFGELWARRHDRDFLVGRRAGRRQAWSRKIVSWVSRLSVRTFYGKGAWDVNTPYRLMRVETFRPFFDCIPADTFAPNVILSGLAARSGLRTEEMPVPQRDRTTGEVSIKKWKLFKAAARSFWQTLAFGAGKANLLMGLLLGALFVLTFGMAIPGVTSWTTVDNDVYVLGGKIMNEGGRMYVDYFDHKGPVMFWLNAWGWQLGHGRVGIWILETLFFAIALGALWQGVRRRMGTVAAWVAAMGILSFPGSVSFANRPESWAVEWTMLSIGLFLGVPGKRASVLAGVAVATVFFMKQTLIAPFAGFFVYLVLKQRGKRMACLSSFAIAACVVAATIMAEMAREHVLMAYFRDCFAFNLLYQNSNPFYAQGASAGSVLQSLQQFGKGIGFWGVLPVLGGVCLLFRCRKGVCSRRTTLAVMAGWVVWVFCEIAFIVRCGRFYSYQLFPLRLACVLAILPATAFFSHFFAQKHFFKASKIFWLVVLLVALKALYFSTALRAAEWMYAASKTGNIRPSPGWEDEVSVFAKTIRALPEEMPLFIWGNCTALYLETGRPSISPYWYWTPLSVDGFLDDNEIEAIMTKLENTPVAIVDEISPNSAQDTPIFKKNTHSVDSTFKQRLRAVVANHYERQDIGMEWPVLYLPKGGGG